MQKKTTKHEMKIIDYNCFQIFLLFPFFFPYQWSRDSKDKTHEVDVFQVLSFFNFGNYPED